MLQPRPGANQTAPTPESDQNILRLSARFQPLLTAYFYFAEEANTPEKLMAEDALAAASEEIDAAKPTSMQILAARILSAAWQTGVPELFAESGVPETSARWRPMRLLVDEARRILAETPATDRR